MAHILLIEDEFGLRLSAEVELRMAGHEVTSIETADKGIMLIEAGNHYDLMVIDNTTPGVA
jgi:DNA-binding NtrC family response regulator